MNKILALACLLMGCSTVPSNQTAQLAGIAEVAAFTGTAYYLADHPEKAPIFEAAKQALDGLIADGNSDPAAFSKALASLPIKELKGDKGAIMVGAAVILWDTYAGQITKLDQAKKVLPVIQAVRNGLARALAKPTAGLNMPRRYEWRGPEPVQGRLAVNDGYWGGNNRSNIMIFDTRKAIYAGPYITTEADEEWIKKLLPR